MSPATKETHPNRRAKYRSSGFELMLAIIAGARESIMPVKTLLSLHRVSVKRIGVAIMVSINAT